jgi:hypothetical protein
MWRNLRFLPAYQESSQQHPESAATLTLHRSAEPKMETNSRYFSTPGLMTNFGLGEILSQSSALTVVPFVLGYLQKEKIRQGSLLARALPAQRSWYSGDQNR